MSNPNDLQSFKPKVYTAATGNVRTRETFHQNGYIDSQLIEEEHLFAQRFPGSNAGGLIIGVTLVTLLGIGGVLWYLLSQSNNKPIQQIILPGNEAPRSTL